MKERLIQSLSKKQLRDIVGQVLPIDESKLSKMSKAKLIPYLTPLSYNEIKTLIN